LSFSFAGRYLRCCYTRRTLTRACLLPANSRIQPVARFITITTVIGEEKNNISSFRDVKFRVKLVFCPTVTVSLWKHKKTNPTTYVDYKFNCWVETEELPKVRGSHVQCKSSNISEIVQDRDVLTDHLQEVAQRIAPYPMTLSDLQGHLLIASFFRQGFSHSCAVVDKSPNVLLGRSATAEPS